MLGRKQIEKKNSSPLSSQASEEKLSFVMLHSQKRAICNSVSLLTSYNQQANVRMRSHGLYFNKL